MPFKRFRRSYATSGPAPLVAIHQRGVLGLNSAAWEALGSPEHVALLYDPDEDVIGVEPVSEDDPDGYRVRQHTRHNVQVAAKAFLEFYKIPDEVRGRRYRAELTEGILTVDLQQESEGSEQSAAAGGGA